MPTMGKAGAGGVATFAIVFVFDVIAALRGGLLVGGDGLVPDVAASLADLTIGGQPVKLDA